MKQLLVISLLFLAGCTERTTLREPVTYKSHYQLMVPNLQVCDGKVASQYKKIGCNKFLGDKFIESVTNLSLCPGELFVPVANSQNFSPAGIVSSENFTNGSKNIFCEEGSSEKKTSISCLPGFYNFETAYCLFRKTDLTAYYSNPVQISAMAIDALGKIYLGGKFDSYQVFTNNLNQGIHYGNSLVKLNPDLSDALPTTLGDINAQGWINDLTIDNAGNIYLAGTFTKVNNQPKSKIAKLKNDGSLDASFNLSLSFNNILKIKQDPKTKKIYVLGYTTTNSYNLQLLRFNENGSLDGTFLESIVVGYVNSVKIDLDSRVYLIGNIESYRGIPIYGSARILPNGLLDNSLSLYHTHIIYLDENNNKLYLSRDDIKLIKINLTDNVPEFYIGQGELSGQISSIAVDSSSETVYLVGLNLDFTFFSSTPANTLKLNKYGNPLYILNDPFGDGAFSDLIIELRYQSGWLLYRTANSFGMRR